MSDGPSRLGGTAAADSGGGLPRLGQLAWSFVGCVVAAGIVVVALAAVSEIALPFTFAAVLAVVFRPLVGVLRRYGLRPGVAAGAVVLALLALGLAVSVATVRGITSQADEISASVDAAIAELLASTEITQASLDAIRSSVESAEPMLTGGFVTNIVSGIGALVGVVGGLILGALIMYYLLKDGSRLRQSAIAKLDPHLRNEADLFVGESCWTLRAYGKGRTVMSVIVSVVIGVASLLLGLPLVFTIFVANFIGGYIPYIGAFLGGGLAVIVALGEGGLGAATIMLVVVVAANLLLENFVEPKVMGRTLEIHPVVVLIVTALGGILGGIVGLILAVPATLIAASAVSHLRAGRYLDDVADRAEPTVRRVLG